MLVEDDVNLIEIYQARLQVEGFNIITAKDGEAALALAVNEHPDLIVLDVMMPRISGFDMLDILRGTDGIKDTKVIMMTALSQAEDKARAEALGANAYLVKSQVTLEDLVKKVHEILGDQAETTSSTNNEVPIPPQPTPTAPQPPSPSEAEAEVAASTTPLIIEASPLPELQGVVTSPETAVDSDQTTTSEQSAVSSQIEDFVNGSAQNPQPPVVQPATPIAPVDTVVTPTQQFDDVVPMPPLQIPPEPVTPTQISEPDLDPNQIAL
jgi:CheY-like chemotaxis protein